jgi:hypothetical protein
VTDVAGSSLKVEYLNYLYKFDKDGSSFFITFRKIFKGGDWDSFIGSYNITLSKLDESPERCIAVGLNYDPKTQRIKLGRVEILNTRRVSHVASEHASAAPVVTQPPTSHYMALQLIKQSPQHLYMVYIKNELFSDGFNLPDAPGSPQKRVIGEVEAMDTLGNLDDSAQNMIITEEDVSNEDKQLRKNINEVIEKIKKVNYNDFLLAANAVVDEIHKHQLWSDAMQAMMAVDTKKVLGNSLSPEQNDKLKLEYDERKADFEKAKTKSDQLLETAEGYLDPMTDEDYEKWLNQHKDNIAKDPNWVDDHKRTIGGSTRKNKYMSRITSRKRRLYRKKSRKGKKAYKKVRSRKITRK